MSYVLRSVFRHLSVKSIPVSCFADRSAFLSRNVLVSRCSTSSWLSNRDDHAQKAKKSFTNLLIRLENDMLKRGMIYLQDLNGILNILAEKQSLSDSLAMKLIQCCGELLAHEPPFVRIQIAQQMWESFKQYGVQYNIDHYNALLKVYIANNYPFNPDEIMKDLRAKRIVPTADTYQYFILKYSQKGDLDNINRILLMMRERNLPIKVDIYRALIMCHSMNGAMDDADNIILIVAKMEPDALAAVYSTLIVEYIRKGNVEKALNIFDTALMKHKYKLNEYFDVLVELAVHNYENEFHRELEEFCHPVNYNYKVPVYISKLIALGKPEYAYAVLKTMNQITRTDKSKVAINPFFISNLVRYDVPFKKIVDICMDMKKNNFNHLALEVAMHESLRMKKEELALNLFDFAKTKDLPIRVHYFWPLLVNRAQNDDVEGVFNLLDVMYKKYGLAVNSETLRFYILPYIYSKTMDLKNFMLKFKPYGVSISSFVNSVVHYLLSEHEFQKAAEIAETYGASYPMHRFEKLTVDLYVETKDCNSFIKLMMAYVMGSLWHAKYKGRQNKNKTDTMNHYSLNHYDIFGLLVSKAVGKLMKRKDGLKYVAELLECLSKKNLSIPSKKLNEIKKILSDNGRCDDYISTLLEKLKMENISADMTFGSKIDTSLSEEAVERLYKDTSQSELGKKYLFNFYARNYDLEKLLELKKKLENENYQFSSAMYSQIIDTLIEHGKWEDAMVIFRERQKEDENLCLDSSKLNRLALLLVQKDRIQDARDILSKTNFLKIENPIRLAQATRTYSDLLKYLTRKGDVQSVEYFFRLYDTRDFGNITMDMLESLVRVHLIRNDIPTALKRYQECVSNYRKSPCKEAILRALALDNDEDCLRKFISSSSFFCGEGKTLYRLVIIYSELNKIKEAKKVLQSKVLKLSREGSKELESVCERYCELNDAKNLLNLFLVTRGTRLLDRDELSTKILTACTNSNDVKNAQALWTEMQEENITPSSNFLNSLAKLLKKNGIPVNFDCAEESEVEKTAFPSNLT